MNEQSYFDGEKIANLKQKSKRFYPGQILIYFSFAWMEFSGTVFQKDAYGTGSGFRGSAVHGIQFRGGGIEPPNQEP
ncbi:MAG: hypothetical protein ONB27_03290 [candidate division KSB1 bacterium]|nr:hypothetical protein [candidate division KSB1 bacterium]